MAWGVDLQPVARPSRQVPTAFPLRDNTVQAQCVDLGEQPLPLALD